MKRILLVLLTICMIFSFISCKDEVKPNNQNPHPGGSDTQDMPLVPETTNLDEYLNVDLNMLTTSSSELHSIIDEFKSLSENTGMSLQQLEDLINENSDDVMHFELTESYLKVSSTSGEEWVQMIQYNDGHFEFSNSDGEYVLLLADWGLTMNQTTEPYLNNFTSIYNCFSLNTLACVPLQKTCVMTFDFDKQFANGKTFAQCVEEFATEQIKDWGYKGDGKWLDGDKAYLYRANDGTHGLTLAYISRTNQFGVVITIE